MINAPSVNQMRCLSSSAFPKALQLIFAASCSAADTIYHSPDARDATTLFVICRPWNPIVSGPSPKIVDRRWPHWPQKPILAGPAKKHRFRILPIHLCFAPLLLGLLSEQYNRSARALDCGHSVFRCRGYFEREYYRQRSLPENFHPIARFGANACRDQRLDRNRCRGIELVCIHGRLNPVKIDLIIVG